MNYRMRGWKKVDQLGKMELEEMPAFFGWLFLDTFFAFAALLSVKLLLQGAFPSFVVEGKIFIPVLLFALVTNFFHGLMERSGFYLWRIPLGLATLLAIEGLYINSLSKDAENLTSGAYAILHTLAKACNSYYSTNFAIAEGSKSMISPCLDSICIILMLALIVVSACAKRRGLLYLWPGFVLTLILLLGYKPAAWGLVFLMLGLLLSHTPGVIGKRNGSQAVCVAGMVCLSLFCGMVVLGKPAELLSKESDEMYAFQLKIEDKALKLQRQVEGLAKGYTNVQNGEVSIFYPNYTGEEMMEVLIPIETDKSIYLRGSYKDTYKNGTWTRKADFYNWDQNLMKEDGFSQEEMAVFLAEEDHTFTTQIGDWGESLLSVADWEYEIHLTGLHNQTLYLPYGSNLSSIEEDYSGKKDSEFTKKGSLDRYYVDALASYINYNSLNYTLWLDSDYMEWRQKVEGLEYYDNYSDFVDQAYVSMPKNSEYIADLAQEAFDQYMDMLGFTYAWDLESQIMATNGDRIQKAEAVTWYLATYYTYSKTLESSGLKDPVEYFLTESKEGFCVHFASAGTLMLRALGVPARYVTGYVAYPQNCKANEEGCFTLSIPDRNSHAWVEIYLEDLGWVPIDVTPSSLEDNMDSLTDDTMQLTTEKNYKDVWLNSDDYQRKQSAKNTEEASSQTDEEEMTQSEAEAESQALSETENSEINLDKQDSSASLKSKGNDQEVAKEKQKKEKALRYLLGVVLALVVLAGIVLFLRKRREAKEDRIVTLAQAGRYKEAALLRHRLVCQELKKALLVLPREVRDQDLAELLKKAFPRYPWETYLEIIEKATYGNQELEAAEYQKIKEAWLHIIEMKATGRRGQKRYRSLTKRRE